MITTRITLGIVKLLTIGSPLRADQRPIAVRARSEAKYSGLAIEAQPTSVSWPRVRAAG